VHDYNDPDEAGVKWHEYFNHLFTTAAEIIADIQGAADTLKDKAAGDYKVLNNFK